MRCNDQQNIFALQQKVSVDQREAGWNLLLVMLL